MILEQLQKIVTDLSNALADAGKFDGGNAAAGTRVRKAAQQAKKDLQDLRIAVQEAKNG
jgi:hypothetical protein